VGSPVSTRFIAVFGITFDVRYAAGRDRQLEAALDQLVAP